VKEGNLKEVPQDPYSDGDLVYRKTEDGFTLYSLGADFDDDGGIENPDNQWGQIKEGGGDRVFWQTNK
jgi:hypothetical protein